MAGFEKHRVLRRPGRVRWYRVSPREGRRGPRTPRRAPWEDHWDRRGVSVSLPSGRPGGPGRKGGETPSAPGPPGRRGEPAGRRNRPPEHRREAGRRGPSDGGSRLPIGRCALPEQSGAENRSSQRTIPAQAPRTAPPEGGPQVLRPLGAAAWRPVFPKTGFLKS